MGKVTQNQKDWQAGYDAGVSGKPGHAPKGGENPNQLGFSTTVLVDGLSWTSGYVEGRAARRKQVQELQEMEALEALEDMESIL